MTNQDTTETRESQEDADKLVLDNMNRLKMRLGFGGWLSTYVANLRNRYLSFPKEPIPATEVRRIVEGFVAEVVHGWDENQALAASHARQAEVIRVLLDSVEHYADKDNWKEDSNFHSCEYCGGGRLNIYRGDEIDGYDKAIAAIEAVKEIK